MGVKSLLRQMLRAASTRFFQLLPGVLADGRLNRTLSVKRDGKVIFRVRDFGEITRMRALTFESKEPETLAWIDGFQAGTTLFDVGANIGVFSLYAAARGCEVVAIEPDALNFALLNENIRLNSGVNTLRIVAYPLALHSELSISSLNVSSGEWGSALSSFERAVDHKGKQFTPLHSQGSVGVSLDHLVEMLGAVPNHLKIDVDGNELLVLQGAQKCLGNQSLQSILIELDEHHPDYGRCLEIIEDAHFAKPQKLGSFDQRSPEFAQSVNHIFTRAH